MSRVRQRRLAPRIGPFEQRLPGLPHSATNSFWNISLPVESHKAGLSSVVALPASFSDSMKNRALNPAYAFALCYAAMVCLAIAVNLMRFS